MLTRLTATAKSRPSAKANAADDTQARAAALDEKGIISDTIDSVVEWLNPPTSADELEDLKSDWYNYGGAGERNITDVEAVLAHIQNGMIGQSIDGGSRFANDAQHQLGLYSERVQSVAAWRDIYAKRAIEAQSFAQGQLSPEAANLAASYRDASARCAAATDRYLNLFPQLLALLEERGYDVSGAQEYHDSKQFGI